MIEALCAWPVSSLSMVEGPFLSGALRYRLIRITKTASEISTETIDTTNPASANFRRPFVPIVDSALSFSARLDTVEILHIPT